MAAGRIGDGGKQFRRKRRAEQYHGVAADLVLFRKERSLRRIPVVNRPELGRGGDHFGVDIGVAVPQRACLPHGGHRSGHVAEILDGFRIG
jgi:hypothetical protein